MRYMRLGYYVAMRGAMRPISARAHTTTSSAIAASVSFVVIAVIAGVSGVRPAWAEVRPTGHAASALPGLHRVPSATTHAPGAAFIGFGYGTASSVFGTGDNHHRASAEVAASVGIRPWLALGLQLSGRYDLHTGIVATDMVDPANEDESSDDGFVGDPRLVVSAQRVLAPSVYVGGRMSVWMPGNQAPSLVLSATTLEMRSSVSYVPTAASWRLHGLAGYVLDRTDRATDDTEQLSRADRLSLGVSESNAVLLGVGASFRRGGAEFLAEWTWDVMIGADAPPLATSPHRIAMGARMALSHNLTAQAIAEVNMARLPTAADGEPLVRFEPRVTMQAGLHYRFGGDRRTSSRPGAELRSAAAVPPASRGVPWLLRGQVVDSAGGPIAHASVRVGAVTTAASAADVRVTSAIADAGVEADGRFRIEIHDHHRRIALWAQADGYHPSERVILDAAEGATAIELTLLPVLPRGQIRGYVRAFNGKPLAASLTLEPSGATGRGGNARDEGTERRSIELRTGRDGAFGLDVAPGRFRLTVRARGYRRQTRKITVEERGVVIVNIDLTRRRK